MNINERPRTSLKARVTMAELAQNLRTSRWTLRRWIQEGRLPKPTKLGRRYLWAADDIERHLAAM